MCRPKPVYFLGDSNTWGLDPRDPFGNRYDLIYCEHLAGLLGKPCVNGGYCGQTAREALINWPLIRSEIRLSQADTVFVFLGTNDILHDDLTDPVEITGRISRLLALIRSEFPEIKGYLMTPVQIAVPGKPRFRRTAEAMDRLWRQEAAAFHFEIADLRAIAPELSFDGVHLSEKGHRQLAEAIFHNIIGR